MGKLIVGTAQLVVGLFGATALFWLGIMFEHRPAGFLDYTWHGPFGIHFTVGPPEGPFAQLAEITNPNIVGSLANQLKVANGNVATFKGAIDVQNASIAALSAKGQSLIAENAATAAQERQALARGQSDAQAVRTALAAAQGDPECQKLQAVDQAVVARLKS
jgi:hypothetical protein